jgi:hypothetical protein
VTSSAATAPAGRPEPAIRPRFLPRLVAAELLKLRKRRGLFWSTLALVVGPILVGYTVLAVLHWQNPARHGPAGGTENFSGSLDFVAQIGIVAAVIVGVTAGAGDLAAGVFRELVVTGRSRLALFAARVPGGLLFLLPFLLLAFGASAVAAIELAGGTDAPGALLVARFGGWLLLSFAVAYLLALGFSSVVGSRGISIGVLLAWQLAISHILLATGRLDRVLPNAALDRLFPDPGETGHRPISLVNATVTLLVWTLVPLLAGAWRTARREA